VTVFFCGLNRLRGGVGLAEHRGEFRELRNVNQVGQPGVAGDAEDVLNNFD